MWTMPGKRAKFSQSRGQVGSVFTVRGLGSGTWASERNRVIQIKGDGTGGVSALVSIGQPGTWSVRGLSTLKGYYGGAAVKKVPGVRTWLETRAGSSDTGGPVSPWLCFLSQASRHELDLDILSVS